MTKRHTGLFLRITLEAQHLVSGQKTSCYCYLDSSRSSRRFVNAADCLCNGGFVSGPTGYRFWSMSNTVCAALFEGQWLGEADVHIERLGVGVRHVRYGIWGRSS